MACDSAVSRSLPCFIPCVTAHLADACILPQFCRRRDFHLACVRLDRQVPGWRCGDCESGEGPSVTSGS